MQQQPPPAPEAPTAPPPPAGAAAPATATIVTEGAVISLPTNAQQLRGMRERREILRDQLQRAVNRREELVSQLNETGNLEARAGLQQRLTVLDERIVQLERDQAATEQLIANAPADVLAMAREPQSSGNMDDADALGFWAFGLGVGILVTMVAGRWRRRRQRGRGVTAGTGDDPRIERLNQAVDAIAEEVERIGEGQRFVTQLLSERRMAAGELRGGKSD
jgi:hypothetical protein